MISTVPVFLLLAGSAESRAAPRGAAAAGAQNDNSNNSLAFRKVSPGWRRRKPSCGNCCCSGRCAQREICSPFPFQCVLLKYRVLAGCAGSRSAAPAPAAAAGGSANIYTPFLLRSFFSCHYDLPFNINWTSRTSKLVLQMKSAGN